MDVSSRYGHCDAYDFIHFFIDPGDRTRKNHE